MAFYQQEPFYNPSIPFIGSIQGGLQENKSITISGRVLPNPDRFHVNLQCSSRHGADIALHFNPRYDSGAGYIVTNTYQQSQWGAEQRVHQSVLPRGKPFTLMILVSRGSFKISVNGNHLMDYPHRIPFNMVDTVVVQGAVEINSIAFQNPMAPSPQAGFLPQYAVAPGYAPQYACPPGHATPAFSAPQTYSVPYKTIINGGLYQGKNISIQGVIKSQAQRFNINLRHRSGIAMHYNPRFDENVVVRNSQLMDKWDKEERYGGMPFKRGQNFQIVISCNPQHYNVFVNGQQAHTFNYRFTKLNEIDVLEVAGDLTLTSVNV